MKIMVFDVPAESGGALSVLNDFYNEHKKDQNNEYIYVLSKPQLEETMNIKVLRFPWIKKGWLHRLFFDHFIAPKLIIDHGVDEVLSLQNVIVPHSKIYQSVYVHNALPFTEHSFSIFENWLLWTYQNVLGKSIFKSIKKANRVIVQTKWMKKACIDKLNVNNSKIEVIPPKVKIDVKSYFNQTKKSVSTFFYPASGIDFKNHRVIIDACLELKKVGVNNFNVIFTLKSDENKNISSLYEVVKANNLPVIFNGGITRERVFEYYSNSVLIFPSIIETVGLPLIEAKIHRTPILSSDCEFSHEVLDEYENVKYFNPFNKKELAKLMCEMINT